MIVNCRMLFLSLLVLATSTTTSYARSTRTGAQENDEAKRTGLIRGRSTSNQRTKQRRLHNSMMGKGGGKGGGGGGSGGGPSSTKPNDRAGSSGGGGLGSGVIIPRTEPTTSVSGNPLQFSNTKICYNTPYDWKDDMDEDCMFYTKSERCANAREFVKPGARSAQEACCFCNGGSTGDEAAVGAAQGNVIVVSPPGPPEGTPGMGGRPPDDIVITPRLPTDPIDVDAHDGNCIMDGRYCIEDDTCNNCCSGRYQFLPFSNKSICLFAMP